MSMGYKWVGPVRIRVAINCISTWLRSGHVLRPSQSIDALHPNAKFIRQFWRQHGPAMADEFAWYTRNIQAPNLHTDKHMNMSTIVDRNN